MESQKTSRKEPEFLKTINIILLAIGQADLRIHWPCLKFSCRIFSLYELHKKY